MKPEKMSWKLYINRVLEPLINMWHSIIDYFREGFGWWWCWECNKHHSPRVIIKDSSPLSTMKKCSLSNKAISDDTPST